MATTTTSLFFLTFVALSTGSINNSYNFTNGSLFLGMNVSMQEAYEEAIRYANETGNPNITLETDARMDYNARSFSYSDCTVQRVPASVRQRLGLSQFYQKYAHAYGIPVVTSNYVTDKAIKRACYVMRFLFADRKDIRDWFYRRRGRTAIMAYVKAREQTTTIPEHSFLPRWWDQRARGLGATIRIPVSTGGEENLLCLRGDRYFNEDIFLHEFVHGIHNLGATGAIPGFDGRLRHAYNYAKRVGLWRNTYAMSTDREYFSEGTQSFFNVNAYSSTPNGVHNHVNTREKLRRYDPALYNLVKEVFPCANTYFKRCDDKANKPQPQFRMDCKNGGGIVVTNKPPTAGTNTPPTNKPNTPSPPSVCQDSHGSCRSWAYRGECSKNPRYMLSNCCQSCKRKRPTPSCIHTDRYALYCKRNGKKYCNSYIYKENYCKKTCNC